KPNCVQNNFELLVNFDSRIQKSENVIDNTNFYIFTSEKPFIKFIYTPKMGIHQLVYESGGILGLWFGLCAYSICMTLLLALQNAMDKLNIKIISFHWFYRLFSSHGTKSNHRRQKCFHQSRRNHVLN